MPAQSAAPPMAQIFVILNVTRGGVKDPLYLSFNIGAKRRSTNPDTLVFYAGIW
jgi:hypothetical protein